MSGSAGEGRGRADRPAAPLDSDDPVTALEAANAGGDGSLLRHDPVRRIGYLVLAWVALVLGVIGIVVPGLPTTPFVLLSAWAAARGSTRLHRWLRAHRVFGPMIRDWQASGAVSRRAKWAATVTMLACAGLMFATAPRLWMAASGSAVMLLVAIWLWRRTEPRAPSTPQVS